MSEEESGVELEESVEAELLAAVAEVEAVTAAAIIASNGTFKRRAGEASVFRTEEETGGEHEDVYLKGIGEDYLVVVFPARGDFEVIEDEVERIVDAYISS